MNIFEVAVRNKYRFPYKGLISVEDLWDLPLTGLDSVFKALNAKKKQSAEESLLEVKSPEDEIVDTQIEIVKYIVSVKKAENAERLLAKERKEQKQKIMNILANKQDEALKGKSIEELQQMLADLG